MGATAPRIPFQSLMTWDWEGSINRGEEIPDGVTLLRYGKRELAVKHANSREARLELQYMAKQLGANSLK